MPQRVAPARPPVEACSRRSLQRIAAGLCSNRRVRLQPQTSNTPSRLQLLAVATCGAAGPVQQGEVESFVLRCCKSSVLFSLRVCVYLRATQPLADPTDIDGGCSCNCFSSARARVVEEFESRVAPHLGGDAFHQYLSLLFARLGGAVAWVQHVDGQASRNINIRVGNDVREVHGALQREEQALFTLHPSFHTAFKASFDYIDVLLSIATSISALPVPQRQAALMSWLQSPASALPHFLLLPWGTPSSGASLLLRAIPQRCRVISTHSHAPMLLAFEAARAVNGWDSATLPYLVHEVQGLHHRHQQQLQQLGKPDRDTVGDETSHGGTSASSLFSSGAVEGPSLQWEHLPSWHIAAFILKTGDDLRQEELAMQLLRVCSSAFAAAGCAVKMFVYDIVAVAAQAGAFHWLLSEILLGFRIGF